MNAVLGRGMASGRHGEAVESHTGPFLQPQAAKHRRIARLEAWPHSTWWRTCPISTSSEIESTRLNIKAAGESSTEVGGRWAEAGLRDMRARSQKLFSA